MEVSFCVEEELIVQRRHQIEFFVIRSVLLAGEVSFLHAMSLLRLLGLMRETKEEHIHNIVSRLVMPFTLSYVRKEQDFLAHLCLWD